MSNDQIKSKALYKNVTQSRSSQTARQLQLCSACYVHLRKNTPAAGSSNEEEDAEEITEENDLEGNEDDGGERVDHNSFKYIVYPFLWDVLSGKHVTSFDSYFFHEIYGDKLWQMIPTSMRPWWIDAIKEINIHGEFPYRDCTITHPPSVFEDKTEACASFESQVRESLSSMGKALDNDNVTDQNVLCPFGCADSYINSEYVEWALVIQTMLKKVVLKLPGSLADKYRFYMNASDNYYMPNDEYPMLYMNPDWKVRPSVICTRNGEWKALACAHHGVPKDSYRLYPPRSPYKFNVNARRSDIISPIQITPRVSKDAKSSKYSMTARMTTQCVEYDGADSFSLTQNTRMGHNTMLQSYHYAPAFLCRSDLRASISKRQEEGDFSATFYDDLLKLATQQFPDGADSLSKYIQGSTYIPFRIALRKWLSLQKPSVVTYRRFSNDGGSVDEEIKRSWLRDINILQKEDNTGYGFQFRALPLCNMKRQRGVVINMCPLWMMYSLLSSVSELWDTIDGDTTFTKECWQGLLLTNVCAHAFQQETVRVARKHPFKKMTVTETAKKFNECCGINPQASHTSVVTADLFRSLFASYGNTFKIFDLPPDEVPVLNGFTNDIDNLSGTKFLIFVNRGNKVTEDITVDGQKFEHRVLLCISEKPGNSLNFQGCRLMRYGGKFLSYWIQDRNDKIVAQYQGGSDLGSISDGESLYFVSLYVREEPVEDYDKYKVEMLKSLGGQGHVVCQCCNFPLIASPTQRRRKKNCNAWSGDGEYQACSRKESFVCSNPNCNVRCCRKCFKSKPKDVITTLVPHDHRDESSDDDGSGDEDEEDDNEDIEGVEEEEEENDYNSDTEGEDNEASPFDLDESTGNDALVRGVAGTEVGMMNEELHYHTSCPFDLIHADQDNNFDSNDGINTDSIPTTDAGIYHTEFRQREGSGVVNGRVLLNQMGSLLKRRNKNLTGTQREQNFTQRLAAASSGTSSCLLYPEGSIFSRHFWSNASSDGITPLGGLPLFSVSGDSHLGLAPIDDQLRTRLMSPFSALSTDANHTSFVYDIMTNLALNKGDSRVMAVRGLQVSGKKLISREEDSNDDIFQEKLSGDVDGHRNVRNLCASMEYIGWSHFYTLTLSHLTHPGIRTKFEWKEKQKWLQFHPQYPHIPECDMKDFCDAFDDLYSHHVTPKWLDVADIILNTIQNQLTHIGAVTAQFARHEYQDSAGEFVLYFLSSRLRFQL